MGRNDRQLDAALLAAALARCMLYMPAPPPPACRAHRQRTAPPAMTFAKRGRARASVMKPLLRGADVAGSIISDRVHDSCPALRARPTISSS